jgi:hypothetical protein
LPEEARLADPPNLMPPRDNSLLPVLHLKLAQRVHQVRAQLFESFVI